LCHDNRYRKVHTKHPNTRNYLTSGQLQLLD
jgi:hypothetical protein